MITVCPHCGKTNELKTQVLGDGTKHEPSNGDISICWTCLRISIFDFECSANVRLPTDDELKLIDMGEINTIVETAKQAKGATQ